MTLFTRSLSLVLVTALASLGAAACGTSEAATDPEPANPATATKAAASTDDLRALCVETLTRNRACTTEYIPALVDARARHDVPAGITEAVKEDRNAVIQQAMTEWADDSKDEAISATCDRFRENPPPNMENAAGTQRGCLQQAECGAYVACTMPLWEKSLEK